MLRNRSNRRRWPIRYLFLVATTLGLPSSLCAQQNAWANHAVVGNVGTKASFRIGTTDAEFLAKQFEPVFSMPDLVCAYGQESAHRARLVVAVGDPGTPERRILAEILYPHDLPARPMQLRMRDIIEEVQSAAILTAGQQVRSPKEAPRT